LFRLFRLTRFSFTGSEPFTASIFLFGLTRHKKPGPQQGNLRIQ
jgi:hypothetical protein